MSIEQRRIRNQLLIFIAIGYLLLGAILILSSFRGITGFSIAENIGYNSIRIIGVAMIVIGILVLQAERGSERGLRTIIRTKNFEKAIKGHNMEEIERAVSKIGTGLGREEKLKREEDYSIRTSKGGRIIYRYANQHIVELKDYTPAHDYKRH